MRFYLTYSQTPELSRLATMHERDAVHSLAWRQLRATRPKLWRRSIAIIVACVIAGCLIGAVLKLWFSLQVPMYWAGGLGGGVGTLLHIHTMAISLRPLYAQIISKGLPATA